MIKRVLKVTGVILLFVVGCFLVLGTLFRLVFPIYLGLGFIPLDMIDIGMLFFGGLSIWGGLRLYKW